MFADRDITPYGANKLNLFFRIWSAPELNHSFTFRNRKALLMTGTELKLAKKGNELYAKA